MRITPCVAGCCGPKFTSRSVVLTSRKYSRSPEGRIRASSPIVMLPCRSAIGLLAGDPVVLLREHVVLPKRIPDPVVREQDVPRIGMADERDPEHLGALALVPL